MKNIFVIGAGRTSLFLIEYLLNHAEKENWLITVGDISLESALDKIKNHPCAKAVQFDIKNEKSRKAEIFRADLVISFLPPELHMLAAKDCLAYNIHLLTASYVSKEMIQMKNKVKKKGITFLNELGLDPGIDHMSIMRFIDKINSEGGKLTGIRSYCGALVSPESNNNPWNYKFTWNPRSIVLQGQKTARYIRDGKTRFVPPHRIFIETEDISIPDIGVFEAYYNRDSIPYLSLYGISDIETFYRATLRYKGFSAGWDSLVRLGITDNSYTIDNSDKLTFRDFVSSFLPSQNGKDPLLTLLNFTSSSEKDELLKKINSLNLFSDNLIEIENATPADVLQKILEKKWVLEENDKDMIVMQHQFDFIKDGKNEKITTSMVLKGENKNRTAISKTVGLPAAITAKYLLNGTIKERGVIIPTYPDIYNPVLDELEKHGICFEEKRESIT